MASRIMIYTYASTFHINPADAYNTPFTLVKEMLEIHSQVKTIESEEIQKKVKGHSMADSIDEIQEDTNNLTDAMRRLNETTGGAIRAFGEFGSATGKIGRAWTILSRITSVVVFGRYRTEYDPYRTPLS